MRQHFTSSVVGDGIVVGVALLVLLHLLGLVRSEVILSRLAVWVVESVGVRLHNFLA